MRNFTLFTFTCILILLGHSGLEAQMITNDQTLSGGSRKARRYHLGISNTVETNLYSPDDKANKVTNNSTTLFGNYRLDGGYILSSFLTVDKKLTQDRESILRDGVLSLDKNITNLNRFWRLAFRTRMTLPFSKRSRLSESRRTSISFSPRFIASGFLDGLMLILTPSFQKNFYEFETNLAGRSNTDHRYSISATAIYQLTDRVSLISSNAFFKNILYVGDNVDQYSFSQEVAYSFTNNFSASLGHAIGGSLLQNGQEYSLQLFDQDASSVYVNMSYQY